MKFVILCAICTSLFTVASVGGTHLVIGNVLNKVMVAERASVKYNAFPFMKRVKNFFYSLDSERPIQGIQALDNLHSKATINVTAGGLGYSYVNLRMKSERGKALDYDIAIYVPNNYYN